MFEKIKEIFINNKVKLKKILIYLFWFFLDSKFDNISISETT